MSQEDVENYDSESQDQDPTQNLKAEFSRKFENLQARNEELRQSNEQVNQKLDELVSYITTNQQQSQKTHQDDDDDDYIDPYDPNFWKKKEQAIEQKVEQKITQSQAQQQERAQALGQLIQDYPELNDDNTDLTKKALDNLSKLDAKKQASAEGYKLAVYEAAKELGVLPMSKRKPQNDDDLDDMIGSGGSGMRQPSSHNNASSRKKDDKLSPKTIEIARQFGLDVNDKKVMERLKKRAARKNWMKYE